MLAYILKLVVDVHGSVEWLFCGYRYGIRCCECFSLIRALHLHALNCTHLARGYLKKLLAWFELRVATKRSHSLVAIGPLTSVAADWFDIWSFECSCLVSWASVFNELIEKRILLSPFGYLLHFWLTTKGESVRREKTARNLPTRSSRSLAESLAIC